MTASHLIAIGAAVGGLGIVGVLEWQAKDHVVMTGFRFDARESLRLTPGSTLRLFAIIGERAARPGGGEGQAEKYPRCEARLRRTTDMQRSTRFEHARCPHDHGRFESQGLTAVDDASANRMESLFVFHLE
ncbi:MAG: hypothetical protein ACT4QD_27075 [Acidobacteriota bacterium]